MPAVVITLRIIYLTSWNSRQKWRNSEILISTKIRQTRITCNREWSCEFLDLQIIQGIFFVRNGNEFWIRFPSGKSNALIPSSIVMDWLKNFLKETEGDIALCIRLASDQLKVLHAEYWQTFLKCEWLRWPDYIPRTK